jgi:hypothetical protein
MNGVGLEDQNPTATDRPSNANKRKFNDTDLDNVLFAGDNTHWQQASDWEFFGTDISDLMTFDSL